MKQAITVAVVYHSGYGHTERQAQAVAKGAATIEDSAVLLVKVDQVDQYWDRLQACDAQVFGAPTYMGSASAQFKGFMDATSKVIFNAFQNGGAGWGDKVAAGFTNSASRSGDKLATLQQLAIFAAQHGMHWVNLGLPPGHNASTTSEDTLNRHGYFLGAGAQSDADTGPEHGPSAADLLTAEHLGRRVAGVARQLAAGRSALAR